jgi:hypothetical protein
MGRALLGYPSAPRGSRGAHIFEGQPLGSVQSRHKKAKGAQRMLEAKLGEKLHAMMLARRAIGWY